MPEHVEEAWWCPSRDRLGRAAPKRGDVDTHEGPLEPGRSGLHASALLLDALAYGETPIVCRVELEGEVVVGLGQRCARVRRVVWVADVSKAFEHLAMTALPTLVRRIVRAFGNAPPELAAIADARPDDREAAAAAALGLREKADDERRDAEWSGKDPARIATARRRAGAAHAAVLLTDATSNEAAHLFRTAERIAAAAAWLAFSWEGASFDDELVVARTLVSAWLGKAAEQREDPVNLDTYMRISRPVVTEPVAVAVAEPELVRDAPARGLSLFRTLMDFERLRTPHVTGASQACWRCGAMRRGPITASSLCLACGARLSRNTSPDVASEDESENLSSGSLAAPRPRPMTFMHQASCDACGCTSERWGRPFDMSDMCPICLGMGTLVPC